MAMAPAFFYCAYAIRQVMLIEARFARRETRLKSQLTRRADEFTPNEVRQSRHYFEGRLEQEIKRSRRHRLPLCLVTLDTPVDKERTINTSQLVEVTTRVLRAEDVAGRLGRGLYAIYLPHTTPAGAAVVIERLQRELGTAVHFGFAYLDRGQDATPDELIKRAVENKPVIAAA
jgi:GGDEF domain-containing protein